MSTYLKFRNEEGFLVEVEFTNREQLKCRAYYFDDIENCFEFDFDLTDVDASYIGTIIYNGDQAMKIYYNPYSEGFEYCSEEVVEYLYKNMDNFKLCE